MATNTDLKMRTLLVLGLLSLPLQVAAAGCSSLYGQCGGRDWTGSKCCATGSSCQAKDEYYSQCLPYTGNAACAGTYGQCGGIGWTGPTCCQSDWTCQYNNDYYYQCLPPPDVATPSSATTTAPSATTAAPSACATHWGQCGGTGWTGERCCQDDWPCVYGNEYYWQCISPSSASALSAQSTSKTSPAASTLSTATSPAATTVSVPNASSTATSSALASPSSTASRTSSATSAPTGGRLQYGGVNIAGFEFGTYDTCGVHTNPPYVNPTNWVAQINHFVNDVKLNAFRLPVAWQYLINQYDGAAIASNTINTGNFAKYDQLVSGCLNSGAALCLIDLHNYARFNGKIIGQDGPTAAQFANLWGQIATKYATQSRVAFNLMNEPHDESCNSPNGGVIDIQKWAATLQLAVNAIRAAGATSQLILLPGKGWTHAATYLPSSSDGSGPALLGITDPAGGTSKLIFEIHEYLDSNNSGCNCDCVTNNIDTAYGRGGLSALADYLRSNGRFALLTESGGLNNNNCATYLCQELSFLANNTDVFLGYTTWSAGGFDANYELTETPTQNGNTWTDTSLVTSCVVKCFQGQC